MLLSANRTNCKRGRYAMTMSFCLSVCRLIRVLRNGFLQNQTI